VTARILLAEDHQPLAVMLAAFLESLGHQVVSAGDGVAALAAIQGGAIDLAILDLKLPGMSGVEVLQRVRRSASSGELPVIIMTGVYRGASYAAAAQKLGVKAYLEKPFSKEAFLQAVRASTEALPPRRELIDLLIELHGTRASGTLELSPATRICFLQGDPVSFSSDDFAPFLLSGGHLDPADLLHYFPHGSDRLRLCEAGLLSLDELLEQSRRFLTVALIEAVNTQSQVASFCPENREIFLPLCPVSLPRLAHQAARSRAPGFSATGFLARCGKLYPARTAQYFRKANLLSMAREEIELLEHLVPGRSVAETVATASEPNAAASFLDFLLHMVMLTLHTTPDPAQAADFPQKRLFNRPIEDVADADFGTMSFEDLVEEVSDSIELMVGEEGMAAPLSSSEIDFEQEVQRDYAAIQGKNYYEIFSLTQGGFSFAALKESYFSKTRQYSAEKFMELSGDTLSRAQDVLSHYANAYNTLSNVVAKERYDEMLNANSIGVGGRQDDELQARIQFQSGKVFIEMDDFQSAERALQDAYTLDPQDARTCAFLAWSIYKNPANAGSRASQDKCRMLLSKSLQMGRCAEAFSFRGWMLLDEGRDGLAEGEFIKALKFNPRERLSQAGLRLINERREAEKKGLFRRIFG
jgi:DNA-binding response OmpR family regulator/tetratricopeptide (TPR) repeat protein